MAKKLTYLEVKERIEKEGYELLSKEYMRNTQKLEIKCPKGHIYKQTWRDFQGGCRCPKCSRKGINTKYDFKYVKEYFEKEGYMLLSKEYNKCDEYLTVMCPEGHIYETTFSNFQGGFRCKECAGLKKLSFNEVEDIIREKGYELVSLKEEYKNVHSVIKLKCDKGHVYSTKFYSFKQGHKCPYCTQRKVSFETVKQNIENEGYKLLSDTYSRNNENLDMECPKGHIFKLSYNRFQCGSRCTVCNSSNGEKVIAQTLDSMNIKYKAQYRFKDCKGDNKTLPFDFYIEEERIALEFDGIQHFEPVDFFGGQEEFYKQQRYDAIKNQYCKDNNIKLIRIPYYEFNNIENLLKENFNDYSERKYTTSDW